MVFVSISLLKPETRWIGEKVHTYLIPIQYMDTEQLR